MNARALAFPCGGETLLGVLDLPPSAARDTAVVVVVGGPQVRAGSHRQFTLLARRLAADGWPVLRFDVRGMGDSSGTQRSFEELDDDIAAAVDAACAALPGLRRVVLWGLCDGASAALMYCRRRGDARVAGLALANPWVRSAETLARTHVKHYYLRRLGERDFWRKLLRGGVAWRAARDLAGNLSAAARKPQAGEDFRSSMAAGWAAHRGPILLALSGDDYTAREFLDVATADPAWQDCIRRASVRRVDFDAADHTFSQPAQRQAFEAEVLRWLQSSFGPGGR